MQTHNESRHWMLALGVYAPDDKLSLKKAECIKKEPIGDYSPRYQGKRLTAIEKSILTKLIKEELVKEPGAKCVVIYKTLLLRNEVPKRECGTLIHIQTFWRHFESCKKELNEGN